jgi:hypothetical protein
MSTLLSQASVAVGGAKTGVAGQLIGVVCDTHVIVGGVISCITIVRLHAELLPQSSVAVQVLVMPPVQPGEATSAKVIVTLASQASVAVAVPKFG